MGLLDQLPMPVEVCKIHEKQYGATELEVLGVVWAVKHFIPYLYGHQCDIYTDHEALKSLLNIPQPSGRLARRDMAIQEPDAHILHRSHKPYSNTDTLSRAETVLTKEKEGICSETMATLKPNATSKQGLSTLQRKDKELTDIICFLESGVLQEDKKLAKLVYYSLPIYTC